jgi:hypothetical protein
MKPLFIFILFVLCRNYSIAQKPVLTDTSKIVVRSFDDKALQDLKRNKDFQYDRLTEPAKSLWERFWDWVWWQITQIMRTKQGRTTVWSILLLFGVAAIVFFVVKVMGMNKQGLFARSSESNLSYTATGEDINSISFDEAINNAIDNRNFRLAIRLLYLQSLKHLSDKGYIDWQINKTNNDYIVEVLGKPWQSLFKKLTYNFEYSWYGEMNVAEEDFRNLQVQFQQFNNQLQ